MQKAPFYERHPALTGWLITGCVVLALLLFCLACS